MFAINARSLLPLLAAGWIAGCASLPSPPPLGTPGSADAFAFSGRLAVHEREQNLSGSVRWRHDGSHDEILLSTPLGQGVAQIVNDPSGAVLTTNDGRVYHANDAEQLTAKVTGWRIPVSGMAYWLRGMPQPGSKAIETRDDKGRLQQLAEQDWKIEYASYFDAPDDRLPKRIVLTRPEFEFKLVIDNWERADGNAASAARQP
jgi:outer membrane lipoprotein LolB